jgi:hypothetical protein
LMKYAGNGYGMEYSVLRLLSCCKSCNNS